MGLWFGELKAEVTFSDWFDLEWDFRDFCALLSYLSISKPERDPNSPQFHNVLVGQQDLSRLLESLAKGLEHILCDPLEFRSFYESAAEDQTQKTKVIKHRTSKLKFISFPAFDGIDFRIMAEPLKCAEHWLFTRDGNILYFSLRDRVIVYRKEARDGEIELWKTTLSKRESLKLLVLLETWDHW